MPKKLLPPADPASFEGSAEAPPASEARVPADAAAMQSG